MNIDELLMQGIQVASPKGEASVQTNDELYLLVVVGDEVAITRMIEVNMALVVLKVTAYLRHYPQAAYLQDELLSEGFLGLTRAVRKIAEDDPIDDPKPTRYLEHWIMCHIGAVIDLEDANGESDRLKRLRRQHDKPTGLRRIPMPEELSNPSQCDESVDPMAMTDLRDMLDACCETENDKIILDMREKGYRDSDIGNVLGIPYSTTYMLRRAIYERFLEKSGMSGEI